MENTDEKKDKKPEDKDHGIKDGLILGAEDHIKITDKTTGEVVLNKRG